MNEDQHDRLSRQVAHRFRGRDPSDPEVATGVESTITRLRRALDRFDAMPHPGPEFPSLPPVNFSDSDATELKRLVLSRLPRRAARLLLPAAERARRLSRLPQSGSGVPKVLRVPHLLICVDGDASHDDAVACREEAAALAQRGWTYAPRFVDQTDPMPGDPPDESPILRTAGVVMELPEPGEGIDAQAMRSDVDALVSAMSSLAKRRRMEFSVEYREEQIGFLDGGEQDARVVPNFFGS
jgi:hypothetical protein